jgi:hypothetical protein
MRKYYSLRRLALASVGSLLLAPLAHAQSTPKVAELPGVSTISALPIEQQTNLKMFPLALLAKFPEAGNAMARFVAESLRKDPAIADAILSVVPDTSPAQASAIGAGFVRAMRGMVAKQPRLVASISQKIMRSDNLWFKTTYFAIGPRLGNLKPPAMLTLIAPPVPGKLEGGLTLSDKQGRIGPQTPSRVQQRAPLARGADLQENESVNNYGTVVAFLSSDSSTNGAVSTSPTN